MPSISGKYDLGFNTGPLIRIGIVAAGVTPVAHKPLETFFFHALIDTGATITCISEAVAKSAGIRPIGMREVKSATHSTPKNLYLVNLILPLDGKGQGFRNIEVMEFVADPNDPIQGLLGMDVIKRGNLIVNHDGHFTFCL